IGASVPARYPAAANCCEDPFLVLGLGHGFQPLALATGAPWNAEGLVQPGIEGPRWHVERRTSRPGHCAGRACNGPTRPLTPPRPDRLYLGAPATRVPSAKY